MSSICLVADFVNNERLNAGILAMMGKTMKHRGPDETGMYLGRNVIMHHNRLSVIDVEGGKQPMSVSCDGKKYTIIYNGEIYNTDELKKELTSHGAEFKTNSDTEVVLWSYIVWKEDCTNHLNGFFAFCIYDEDERKLYMARDRFGVKPLFYAFLGSTLLVASEMKAILSHPMIKPKVDKAGLWQLLFLSPVTFDTSTVFRDIYKLGQGQYAVFTSAGMKIETYWQLEAEPFNDSRKEAIYNTKELLKSAVNNELRSDVPLCTFLSGGLDSSAVSAIASKTYRENGKILDTYSFEYEGNKENFKSTVFQPQGDDEFAKSTGKFLGTNHTVLTVSTKDITDALFSAVDARDFPGHADVDSSLICFGKKVKEKHTVAMSGECSDELCGGYPWFYREEMLKRDFFPWIHDPFIRVSLFKDEKVMPEDGYNYISDRYKEDRKNYSFLDTDSEAMRNSRTATNLSVRFFMSSLLERKDRMAMSAGIEARVPFADHNFAQYMYNVPWEIKFENGVEKALLRNAMEDFLPESITHRKKSPYPKTHNPEYERLVTELLMKEMRKKDSLFKELCDTEKITQMLTEDSVTWFGQLMAKPQLVAWLVQFAYWLDKYNIVLV